MENNKNVQKHNPVLTYLDTNKGILIALVALLLIFGALTQFAFWKPANLLNIVRNSAMTGMIAFGEVLIIITGGIDLSVGAIEAIASTYCAGLILNGWGFVPAMLVGLVMATAMGAFNGALVSMTKVPPFIVTLASMNIARGIAYMLSNGTPIAITDDRFGSIGNGYLFNVVPYPIIYMAVIMVIMVILVNKTKYGRNIFAIGGNVEAARFSGINVKKHLFVTYVIAGFLYGIAGIVYAARLYSGQPTLGQGAEMNAIAAAIVGGAAMSGGVGRIGSTFIGALIIAVLNCGLDYLSIPFYWQTVAEGVIVLGAVLIDVSSKNGKKKKKVKKA